MSDELERRVAELVEQGDGEALTALTLELFRSGRLDRAERAARGAVAAGARDANALLGMVLDRGGRLQEAEVAYRNAIAEGEDQALVHLADMLLLDEERRDEVDRLLRLAVEREVLSAWYVLGKLLRRQPGREAEAEAALAAETHPSVAPAAQLELARLLAERPGREEDAERAWRASGLPDAAAELAMWLYDIPGREAEAPALLRRAAEGGRPGAWNNLTLILQQLGQPAQADAAYRDAIAHGELDLLAHYGEFLRRAGRAAEAEQVLRRGVGTDPLCAYVLGAMLAGDPERGAEGRRLLVEAAGAGVPEAAVYLARER